MTHVNAVAHRDAPSVPRVTSPSAEPSPAPTLQMPEPTPYEPGVGTWLGVGGATIGGALLGAGAGAMALALLNWRAGAGASLEGAMTAGMAIGGVLGAAGGGFGTYSMLAGNHRERELARIDATFGRPVDMHAASVIDPFDHNDNGRIDLVNATGLASHDERIALETREQSRRERHYDWIEDDWDTTVHRWTEERARSAADIWSTANANGDDLMEQGELEQLMRAFDEDGSGTLTTAERERFEAAHPMIVDEWKAL